jgi:hypothetical protein
MSIFHSAQAICGSCGTRNLVERTASVNADRAPEYRDAILDGSFQRETCSKCGTVLRLPPHLTYLDIGRNQWVMVEPSDAIKRWQKVEADARKTWDRAFGSGATPQGKELGRTMTVRLVLGWTALREKLLCWDLGLDDVTLEMLKLDLLRDMENAPIADQTELRLRGGDAQTLKFDWLELASERAIEGFEVPRADYDEIVADAEEWADLRARFDGALMVDWRRLMFADATA